VSPLMCNPSKPISLFKVGSKDNIFTQGGVVRKFCVVVTHVVSILSGLVTHEAEKLELKQNESFLLAELSTEIDIIILICR
jgi:hypothetical protein